MSTGLHLYYGLRIRIPSRPPVTLETAAGQYDLVWLDPPLTPAAPTQDILPTAAGDYVLRWLDVDLEIAGPTSTILLVAPAEFVLIWLDVDVQPAAPTVAVLPVSPAGYVMEWRNVDIDAAGPTVVILNAQPAFYQLRWLDIPLISSVGSGAACISGGAFLEAPQWPAREVNSFAMAGWFQINDRTVSHVLVSKWNFPTGAEFVLTVTTEGRLEFAVNIQGSIEFVDRQFPDMLQEGVWYFAYAQRTKSEIAVGIGDTVDSPSLTIKPVSLGATDITSTPGRFGTRQVNAVDGVFLQGRLDDWSFWRSTPGASPAELWAARYENLTPAQLDNLASWWKFDDDGLGVWRDAHSTFDLDSKPTPTSVLACDGREFVQPSQVTLPVTPAEFDVSWLDVTIMVDSPTQSVLDTTAGQFELTWLDVIIMPAGGTQDVLLHAAAEFDLAWLDVDIEPASPTSGIVSTQPARYDMAWLDVNITGSPPLTAILPTAASEYDVIWLDNDFEVGGFPPGSDILAVLPARYELTWLDVLINVSGPTEDVLIHGAARFDLSWIDTAPIEVATPPAAIIDVTSADYGLTWIDTAPIEVASPPAAVLDYLAAEYDLRWLDVQLNPAAPAACFTSSAGNFMDRNLPLKQGGQFGWQTGDNFGLFSVWTKNEAPPDQPNAGFVLSGTGDGDGRFQMGFSAVQPSGDVFAYFEMDTGEQIGTNTAQSVTNINLQPGWNHHLFGFDPSRISENGGGWVYWLNSVEVLMELGNLQTMDGGWFAAAQTASGSPFRYLTVAANRAGGVISDPWGVCLTNMVYRGGVTPNQAQADFFYVSSQRGTLASEIVFPAGPGPNDFAWPVAEPGFGDELWGDGSVGRDRVGFFQAANPIPEQGGIEGRGNGATPPDLL